ncbi:hypothetical protein B296_00052076 [Ensete ventricosum]|uniref:Uncharacterized protein n=1 Tax=Ensete ventricosum TaxID=4639 RepID=A0A426X7U6_ENSVE|nr:hypothetical protein B296_00052076 [Ensete ventricosum]
MVIALDQIVTNGIRANLILGKVRVLSRKVLFVDEVKRHITVWSHHRARPHVHHDRFDMGYVDTSREYNKDENRESQAYPSLVADQRIGIHRSLEHIANDGLCRGLLSPPSRDHVGDPDDSDERHKNKRKPVRAGAAGREGDQQHGARKKQHHVAEPEKHGGPSEGRQLGGDRAPPRPEIPHRAEEHRRPDQRQCGEDSGLEAGVKRWNSPLIRRKDRRNWRTGRGRGSEQEGGKEEELQIGAMSRPLMREADTSNTKLVEIGVRRRAMRRSRGSDGHNLALGNWLKQQDVSPARSLSEYKIGSSYIYTLKELQNTICVPVLMQFCTK